jgi:hypothetical protein
MIHWLCRVNDIKAYCGILVSMNTTHKDKVTCLNCIRLMRLHNHLPESRSEPGHVTSTPDPSEGDGATLYCVTCEEEARRVAQPCGHVPARPDVDLTLCWICGEEILPDPDTHLWRPLTATEKLVKYETTRQLRELFFQVHSSEYPQILFERLDAKRAPAFRITESIMGRWIIVNGQHEDLAWSGSRWVPHRNGLPVISPESGYVSNWETREEAQAYVSQYFPPPGESK